MGIGESSPLDRALRQIHERGTIATAVAEQLKALIIHGTFPPGTRLPQTQVAMRLGLSVTPVRDALRILEAERLVVLEPRKGAVVAELSSEDIEEIYAIRAALESLAARHVATAGTSAQLDESRQWLARMADAARTDSLDDFIEFDREFHLALYRCSGRSRLVAAIEDLQTRSRRYHPFAYRSWLPLGRALSDHQAIFRAIEEGDEQQAATLTREHLEGAAGRLLAELHRPVTRRSTRRR